MAEHWMAGARRSIEKRGTKGVFKRAAQRAGMGTGEYARHVSSRNKKWRSNHPGEKMPASMAKVGKRAGLAKAFASSRS
jgi:hypothetical protein